MSEQSEGSDWWLASDGRWYPPQPSSPGGSAAGGSGWVTPGESPGTTSGPVGDPPPPTGTADAYIQGRPLAPPLPTHRSRKPWLVGVLVLGAAGLVAVVAVTVTATRPHHSSTKSVSVAPATGQVVTARNGTVALTLPEGWRGADISNGVDGVGARLVPDSPEVAARLQQRLGVLPRVVVIFGIDGSGPDGATGFLDNVNVLSDPTAPSGLSLDEVGRAETRSIGQLGTITSQGVVDLGSRQAYRVTYTTQGFAGIAYVIQGSQDTWVVTYSFSGDSLNTTLTDASAMTFTGT